MDKSTKHLPRESLGDSYNSAEGQEFANIMGSLEQFIQTVGQNNFGNKIPYSNDYH